jgi:pilus assembly protein CpaB
MKNSRALIMLGAAMLAGLAAVVFASRWLINTSSNAVRPVAVAVDDINLGQPLNTNFIRIVNWPSGSVPPGAFSDAKSLDGRVVDVIVNTQQPGGNTNQQSISKIVLEKILVLAIAQQVSRDDTQPKVVNAVTLQVTPDQAEKLDLARSVGTLSLVLRNQVDDGKLKTTGATKLTLLDASAPAPTTPKPERVRYVAARPQPHVKRECVGVLSGASGSLECF